MPDKRPEFRVQLTHPRGSDDHVAGRRAVLRAEEQVSGQTVFELELTSEALHDLLSQSWAYTSVRRLGPHPERWGHEMEVTGSTYATEAAALDAVAALEARGWTCDTLRRNNSYRWVVTGRRWDGKGDDAEAHPDAG